MQILFIILIIFFVSVNVNKKDNYNYNLEMKIASIIHKSKWHPKPNSPYHFLVNKYQGCCPHEKE